MSGFLWRLLKQGGLYALGNLVVKLSGLILAPLLLNPALLSEAAFGHLVLLEAAWQVLIALAGLGIGHGMLKYMTDPAYVAERDAMPFTALVLAVVSAAVIGVILAATARPLASFILDDPGETRILVLFAGYVLFKLIGAIPFSLLRIRERADLFVVALVAEMILIVGGVYLALAVLDRGLAGVMEAYLAAAGVSTLIMSAGMLGHVRWKFQLQMALPLLKFGLPIAIAGVVAVFLNAGDRYLLKWLTDAEVVAVYGWAGKLGSVINMLFVHSFQLAFVVIGLKALGESEEAPTFYRTTFKHYVIWTGWAVLGLSLFAFDVTALLARSDLYLEADPLILPIALGFMCYGVYYILVNVLYVAGKSDQVALSVFVAAVFNLAANLALIPILDAMGAAIATLLSYLFLMGIAAHFANRQRHIRYPWRILFYCIMLVAGLYFLARGTLAWDTGPRLLARFGIVLIYPAVLVATGLYAAEELRILWRDLRARINGGPGSTPGA